MHRSLLTDSSQCYSPECVERLYEKWSSGCVSVLRRRARLRRWKEDQRHSKRHILVDTEGFVLKTKVMSAKVMDFERGSRRCCIERRSDSLACVICG